MGTALRSRSIGVGFSIFLAASASTAFNGTANAQTASGFTPGEIATNSCWVDAKTGARVPTGPGGWLPGGGSTPGGRFNNPDPNHVEDGETGRTYVNDPDKGWINSQTGDFVPTGPGGWLPGGGATPGGRFNNPDPNHVEDAETGRSYVRVPCPSPDTKQTTAGGAKTMKSKKTTKPRAKKVRRATKDGQTGEGNVPAIGIGIGIGVGMGHERRGGEHEFGRTRTDHRGD